MRVAVASGKGGTGKTFVSTNLFHTFWQAGISASLVDCDAEVPNALTFFQAKKVKEAFVEEYRPIIDSKRCTFCGKCADYCAFSAIFFVPKAKQIRLLDDLCQGCSACSFACAEYAIRDSSVPVGKISTYKLNGTKCLVEGRMDTGKSSPVPIIKAAVKVAAQLKTVYTIVDSPPGTACPFIQAVSSVDFVVLVTEPTPFGLSDLKQAVETLRTMSLPFGVVVNRAGIGDVDVYAYLNEEYIELLGEIPFDREIAKLYSEGRVAVNEQPKLLPIFEQIIQKLAAHGSSHTKR